MENDGEISISQALNQIQSWLNAGEYDKVVQGAQEILEVEPSNARALSLLKQGEEKRHQNYSPTATSTAIVNPVASPTVTPTTSPMPTVPDTQAVKPAVDPLAALEVEREDEDRINPMRFDEETKEKQKLFLAMLIPGILVVLVGGGIIWSLANQNREAIIHDIVVDSNLPQDTSYLDENQERLDTLSKISIVLEQYKAVHGAYPSVSQVESVVAQSSSFEEIPSDPRQGEVDKASKPFGYVYAIYKGIGGENSVFILSALFEDSEGFGYAWTKGAPVKNYPDYRNYKQANVSFIGGDEADIQFPESSPDSSSTDSPSTGPKVNPDNL